jgi:hypothetical protein
MAVKMPILKTKASKQGQRISTIRQEADAKAL